MIYRVIGQGMQYIKINVHISVQIVVQIKLWQADHVILHISTEKPCSKQSKK